MILNAGTGKRRFFFFFCHSLPQGSLSLGRGDIDVWLFLSNFSEALNPRLSVSPLSLDHEFWQVLGGITPPKKYKQGKVWKMGHENTESSNSLIIYMTQMLGSTSAGTYLFNKEEGSHSITLCMWGSTCEEMEVRGSHILKHQYLALEFKQHQTKPVHFSPPFFSK